jgi:ACS family pantothenate transporter-like MFS transporter
MNSSEEIVSGSDIMNEDDSLDMRDQHRRSKWARIQEIIWDGRRSEAEKRLVQRLDIFLM